MNFLATFAYFDKEFCLFFQYQSRESFYSDCINGPTDPMDGLNHEDSLSLISHVDILPRRKKNTPLVGDLLVHQDVTGG